MTLIPTQVTFHGLPHSDALDADIRERVAWLEQFHSGIVSCRVLVELPHRHRAGGRAFHVRIEISVGGGAPIVVTQEPSLRGGRRSGETERRRENETGGAPGDAYLTVRQAFDAARRRLQDQARTQRGAVKTHAATAEA